MRSTSSALTYAGSALGITFAGDFLSLFLFWELAAVSAVLLVWLRRDAAAVAAGFRYLLVHVFGGLCLLGGIVLYWSQTGSLAFGDMSAHAGTAGVCADPRRLPAQCGGAAARRLAA